MEFFDSYLFGSSIDLLLSKLSTASDKKRLEKSLQEHIKSLYEKFRYSKNLLFRNSPVDFYSNYIPLTLKEPNAGSLINEPFSILKKYDNIIVLGSAGSGKTTLLRYIILKCIESGFGIPISIDLRTYKLKKSGSFENFVAGHLNFGRFPELQTFWQSGGFIFILDGFDEISYTNDNLLISEIEEFTNQYNKNKFIISSRLGTNVESIHSFHVFEIQNINENDIRVFINRAIPSVELRDKFIYSLQNNEYLRESLSTPMLVSLYLLVVQSKNYNQSNNSKTLFFRTVLDSLFSKHDAVSKLGYVREKVSGLSKDRLEDFATFIAFKAFTTLSFQLSKDQLYSTFNQAKRVYNTTVDNEKLLYDLLVTVNILVEESFCYSFPHVLIMEYLSALFISRLTSEKKAKVYQKILEKESLIISVSFLEFLNELDWHDFHKNYYIPLLEKIIDDFNYKYSALPGNASSFYNFTDALIKKRNDSAGYYRAIHDYSDLLNTLNNEVKNKNIDNSDEILNF